MTKLTARDEGRGLAALKEIQEVVPSSAKIDFLKLDIDSQTSIQELASEIKERHGKVDLLINNAAIAFKGPTFNEYVVETTLATNYYGTKEMCLAFLPLMDPHHGRIVNITSGASFLSRLSSTTLADRFRNSQTMADIDLLMNEFRSDVKNGNWTEKGWCSAAYAVSKMGVTGLTRVLAYQEGKEKPGLLINACCPGWVRTDMAGPNAAKSPEEGTITPLHLAIGDMKGQSGAFWQDMKDLRW
ncbi:hypothetical protein JAAARDRAFT_152450 [Jaapia argillacea MUCL 33604]|uniref:Carbonyl reductase n=1 Tax=Jaapia argillacea MUCL 33604 TaxID=933084 RepID=A0A067Q2S5_9AGAM|nr:hypothetical protein JAAARDRAFT_152450 [Jaapia argillacea MUCL 33604]